MATFAQFAANRANAKKSTGPRSVEGKAASRFNALKHGMEATSIVLPNEDPAEYEALSRDYHQSIRPRTPEEVFQVETMLRADWQKRRLQLVEADLYRTVLSESPGSTLAAALLSDSPAAKLLVRVQRQLAAFERAWFRAHTQLHRNRKNVLETPELASFPPDEPDAAPPLTLLNQQPVGEQPAARVFQLATKERPTPDGPR